jgi:hypothetical protein
MKIYIGEINHTSDPIVIVYDDEVHENSFLNPRWDLANHSPDGFAWGYGGSGPSQLSLAILADHTGDKEFALKYYMDFKWDVISNLDMNNGFKLKSEDVQKWINRKLNYEAIATKTK